MLSPFIDPQVEHVGASRMRHWNGKFLKSMTKTYVIQDGSTPIGVLLRFDTYMLMQSTIRNLEHEIEQKLGRHICGSCGADLSDWADLGGCPCV